MAASGGESPAAASDASSGGAPIDCPKGAANSAVTSRPLSLYSTASLLQRPV